MNTQAVGSVLGASVRPVQPRSPQIVCARGLKAFLPVLMITMIGAVARAGSIGLASGKIDTSKEPAATEQSLRAAAGPEGKSLAILQFDGPIQAGALEQCKKAGAEVYHYIPQYAYLVSLPAAKLDAVRAVKSVAWIGNLTSKQKIHPSLSQVAAAAAGPETIKITILSVDGAPAKLLVGKKFNVTRSHKTQMGWHDTRVEILASELDYISKIWSVFHIELQPEYTLNDERGAQTAAGNYVVGGTSPTGPGYVAWLTSKGLTGAPGLIVQVQDDGLDRGDASNLPGTAHLDILGRIEGIFNPTIDATGNSIGGHGMINAGIIMGNATIGTLDGAGYKLGQGLAPQARVYATKIFNNGGGFDIGTFTFSELAKRAQDAGAKVSSNSWGASISGQYNADAAEFDALTRDADTVQAGDQPMIYFFSAGNSGSGSQSIGAPGTAKNVITVGAGENSDADGTDGCAVDPTGANSLRDIINFSSRGPNADGRRAPTIFSVGTHVQGPASTDPGYNGTGVCDQYWPVGQTNYARSSGTSHSCPTAAGAGLIIYELFQTQLAALGHTANPSPALMKAVLAATATDMFGGNDGAGGTLTHIPDNNQGWGAVNLKTLIDNKMNLYSLDQTVLFTASGQSNDTLITSVDASKPLKIALVWTDAPGSPGVSPEMVNDLDLEVTVGATTYLGNVFNNGFSTTGGAADRLNNLEMVSIQNPSGLYTIRVKAFNIAGNGVPSAAGTLDQDFALFVWNGIDQTSKGILNINKSAAQCSDTIQVLVSDRDLRGAGTSTANVSNNITGDAENYVLTETGANTGVFTRNINIATGAAVADGIIQAANASTITATYNDANDGTGSPAIATDTAAVDCVAPIISNVAVTNLRARAATITFDTNEQASGKVRFGTSCGSLTQLASGGQATNHQIPLSGLLPLTTYYFAVDATDPAGNSVTNDNGGTCYSFTTLEQPDYFTEQFGSSDNDLGGGILTFSPDGSPDYYNACLTPTIVFPTNPAGGTPVILGDDNFVQVTLGSPLVSLYGTSYNNFYIGSNGYITFSAGDSSLSETLPAHFGLPRIAGLFDDLNPSSAGTVSWKQTADRVAVTWQGVTEYGTMNSNSFQIEMFFDGTIQITHLNIDAFDGLSGLSQGLGVPSDFFESDLSAYGSCQTSAGIIDIDKAAVQCSDAIEVLVSDIDLRGAGTVVVNVSSVPPGDSESVFLTETGLNTGILKRTLTVATGAPGADGVIQVANGGTITATYNDADVGTGSPAVVTDTAAVDCVAPIISNVVAINIAARQATVTFDTNETATSMVHFGTACGSLTDSQAGALASSHSVDLLNLLPQTVYYFSIEATDTAGNLGTNNNGGTCFTFTTPCDPNLIVNGSFETGDFTGWTTLTGAGTQLTPWNVTAGPGPGYFLNGYPAEGSLFAENGFDGSAGLTYDIFQEVAIPSGAPSVTLNWKERIQWDLVTYCIGCSLSRVYTVTIQPAGGGAPLATLFTMTLNPGTTGDTGYVAHVADLVAAYPAIRGTTVRLNWHETIPETLVGPGQFDFDDVSLIANCQTPAGTIQLSKSAAQCSDTIQVTVSDTDLQGAGSVNVTVASLPTGDSESVTLLETGPGTGVLTRSLTIAGGAPAADGIIQVSNGATVRATYNDADDGTGSPAIAIATADVDCLAPAIDNVAVINIGANVATVTFDTNELATGRVFYGTSCGALSLNQAGPSVTSHQIVLASLAPFTTYFFRVEATDPAGNLVTDNNGGLCYQFTTLGVRDYFTELFDLFDNDLANRAITFTPDGSGNFYSACQSVATAYPTDPTGGTPLPLSDDSYIQVSLAASAKVLIYGVDYDSFYVCSNGYITFDAGDSDYGETLVDHFAFRRVSALFDDLDPALGGSISWKQMANRVAITYSDIQEFGGGTPNNFQIELFFDGRIRITFLGMGAFDGLSGISEGLGVPPTFTESDLSGYSNCAAVNAVRDWESFE